MSANNAIVPGFDEETDDSLKITLEKVDSDPSILVLRLTGYVDTYNSIFFQKRVAKAVDAGYKNLIFNCAALNYVSSTGIGSFTAFLKLVKEGGHDGDIVLFEIQPKVYEVFQLLGFSQFFNIKDSLENAIRFFSMSGTPGVTSSVFPKVFACPVCSKKLKVSKGGKFRCSECKTVLDVDDAGNVTLG